MCFDTDSRPPVPFDESVPVDAGPLTLTSADGTRFAAFEAHPVSAPDHAAGVVILPDVRGLYAFYQQLAVSLVHSGHHAVVIDYYGRTAGAHARDAEFPFMEHIVKTTERTILEDMTAGVRHLRDGAGQDLPVFSLGFCFGGRHAFTSSKAQYGLAGAIGYYGFPSAGGPFGPGPTQQAGELHAPILGIFGGADENIPTTVVDEFDAALTTTGVPHDIQVYPGAPHSFLDVKYAEHESASRDAWARTLTFISEHTS